MSYKKKLIEVALPLEAINAACEADKDRKTGHIRNLHKWFAPMPLPAWRAALFASLVDDPSNDLPSAEADRERSRLFGIIERLLSFEAIRDQEILDLSRKEIRKSLGDNNLPLVVDPFCGGGSTIVEAQRLGLPSFASDLNPVPILITTMLCAVPPRVAGLPPVNPQDRGNQLGVWAGLNGFIADVKYYAQLIREQAWKRIGHLYPLGPDKNSVIAWRWARTVASPDPRARGMHTPLVSDWWLSKKRGNKAWVEPAADRDSGAVRFVIRTSGSPPPGTIGRAGGRCLLTDSPIRLEHIRTEGKAGRLGLAMIAMVSSSERGRGYFSPTEEHERAARAARPEWQPDLEMPARALGFRVQEYGMTSFADLFTPRQLVALGTFASLVAEMRDVIKRDALDAGRPNDPRGFSEGGQGAQAYADSVTTMLGICVGKLAQANNVLVRWVIDPRNGSAKAVQAFDRHALPMVWDFTETNPFGGSVGDWVGPVVSTALMALDLVEPKGPPAEVRQLDARALPSTISSGVMVATDPPYYANIGYADLSDFFYVWIRRALRSCYPSLFTTVGTPKEPELIATPFRHDGDSAAAEKYFREGFTQVFSGIARISRADLPTTVVYAFKEQESGADGVSSTGWDVMLDGLLASDLAVVGTWPIRTARVARMIGIRTNALASAILVVCRPRPKGAALATRREFLATLKKELPDALRMLQHGNIPPVDLSQAAIGPGMAIFSRYAKVLEADGTPMSVRAALQIINQELDAYLAAQEGEMDGDTRFCLAWFEQHGMNEAPFGEADVLARAKNTSVQGLVDAGVLSARAGKVRLLKRSEYEKDWDPAEDRRLTVWECTQHLILQLNTKGEEGAAQLCGRLGGGRSEDARALAYRLYSICERKGWAEEALAYNSLVVSWPAIQERAARLATTGRQSELFQ